MSGSETAQETSSPSTVAPGRREGRSAVTFGCLAALASAMLTCGLLFVNGSLVLAILEVLENSGLSLGSEQGVGQFLLFALPVALVVAQWMMIDYVRTRFSKRHH